jgi:ribosomal protein S20
MIRSRIKTETKKLLTFLQEGKVQEAKSFFPEYQAILMRSATKGYIPENRARRLLSRIQSRLHKLTSSG